MPVLHLDLPRIQEPVLHPDVSGIQKPVLRLDVPRLQKHVLRLDISRLQEHSFKQIVLVTNVVIFFFFIDSLYLAISNFKKIKRRIIFSGIFC